jgi:hypothetical protein
MGRLFQTQRLSFDLLRRGALNIQYSNQDMQAPKYPFGKPCRLSGTPRTPHRYISFSAGCAFEVLALSLHLLSERKTINYGVFDHSQCIFPRPPSRLTLPNLANLVMQRQRWANSDRHPLLLISRKAFQPQWALQWGLSHQLLLSLPTI